MNEHGSFERFVADRFAIEGRGSAPADEALDAILTEVRQTRQRPRWLALITAPPMRVSSRVTVGSPAARLVTIAIATLLLAAMATGAAIGGAMLLAGPSAIVVAQDGSGSFETITAAVEAAEEGATILVRPGTYAEAISITKDITVSGDGEPSDIVIEFDPIGPTVTMGSGVDEQMLPVGLSLESSDARVRGLTVSGPDPGLAVSVSGGSPVLDELSIILEGVVLDDDGHPRVSRVAFWFTGVSRPVIRDSAWDGFLKVGAGSSAVIEDNSITTHIVSIDGPGETVVRDNTFLEGASVLANRRAVGRIEGNDFTGGGILVDTGSDVVIRGNTISDVGDTAAIEVIDSEHAAVRGTSALIGGNRVMGAATGIAVREATDVTIEGNELVDNGVGISLYQSDAIVESNAIAGGITGIGIVLGGSPTLIDNTIKGANDRGIVVGSGTSPTLTANTVCVDGTNLLVADGAEPVLADNEMCPDEPSTE